MAPQTDKDRARKEQVFKKLRREILAARLKVTLDEQLNRKTSPAQKRLSEMKLPPITKSTVTPIKRTPNYTVKSQNQTGRRVAS
jgi:hypothetical protein